MHPNQVLWEKGDFTMIAATMRESGAELIERIGIQPGQRVLDLGCGDGTTAIPSAQKGARVLGVDIANNLVAAGNQRALSLRLENCRFQQGDAADLQGFDDQTFDHVVSIFGAMFAAKPFDVAREMVRVTKPGGRITMGNWIPGDPTLVAQVLKISSAYTPPPPEGFISPMTWGVESHVLERFGKAGVAPERVSFSRETYTFRYAGSPAEFVSIFKRWYGPTMNAFEAAAKSNREAELEKELVALFESQNQGGSQGKTIIPATFLLVSVQVG
jgi:ubiquinone/menaquinone biosynthesis C-methylase UbiE